MVKRGTIVHSATNHSVQILIWRGIPSFTVARKSRISAHNATFQTIMLLTWKGTLWSTLGKSRISVYNATILPLSGCLPENSHWRETLLVQSLWIQNNFIFWFEKARDDPFWRKGKDVYNLQLLLFCNKRFENTHDDEACRRKATQV